MCRHPLVTFLFYADWFVISDWPSAGEPPGARYDQRSVGDHVEVQTDGQRGGGGKTEGGNQHPAWETLSNTSSGNNSDLQGF